MNVDTEYIKDVVIPRVYREVSENHALTFIGLWTPAHACGETALSYICARFRDHKDLPDKWSEGGYEFLRFSCCEETPLPPELPAHSHTEFFFISMRAN